MANPNPDALKARKAKRQKARTGTPQDVAAMIWEALEAAQDMLSDEDKGIRLKAIHAMSQTTGSYIRLYEVGELEARLEVVENYLQEQKNAK